MSQGFILLRSSRDARGLFPAFIVWAVLFSAFSLAQVAPESVVVGGERPSFVVGPPAPSNPAPVNGQSAVPAGALLSWNNSWPDGVIEDFEDGNLDEYTILGGEHQVTGSAAHDGAYGLESEGADQFTWIYRLDEQVVTMQGDTISYWVRMQEEGRAYCGFGASGAGTYSIVAGANTDELLLQLNDAFGFDDIGVTSQTWTLGKWYRLEVEWGVGGSISGRLYDSDGTTLLNTVTATDTTFTEGGIAFRAFSDSEEDPAYFDTISRTGSSTLAEREAVAKRLPTRLSLSFAPMDPETAAKNGVKPRAAGDRPFAPRPLRAPAEAAVEDPTATGSEGQPIAAEGAGRLAEGPEAGVLVASDDFDRDDGTDMGPNWTEQAGDWRIEEERARSRPGIAGDLMTFAATSAEPTVSVDAIDTGTLRSNYVALVSKYADLANCLFIKVQDNSGGGAFNYAGFYYGNNVGGWPGMTGGAAFFALTTPFSQGRITTRLSGNSIRLEIDRDFDGTPDETHTRGGIPLGALGNGVGLGGYSDAEMDDFQVGDGVVYEVHVGRDSVQKQLIYTGLDRTCPPVPSPLSLRATYEWFVVAVDDEDNTTTGPLWSFTTEGGRLRGVIAPSEAVAFGAQWRVVGTGKPWRDSGFTESLSPGDYVVRFNDVPGYVKPPNQPASLENYQLTIANVTYQPGLLGLIDPPEAIAAGAMWRVAGTGRPWRPDGFVEAGLAPGDYTIRFKDVPVVGWRTPPNQIVTVVGDVPALVGGTYEAGLTSVILPPEAIAAGARWRIVGIGGWTPSGVVAAGLGAGSYTVRFRDTFGWTTPANQTAVFTPGTPLVFTGAYVGLPIVATAPKSQDTAAAWMLH